MNQIFEEIDVDDSGKVDIHEFSIIALEHERKISQKKLQEAFKYFDINQDGFVSKNELEHILGDIQIEEVIWEDILGEVDTNGDGQLNLEEFINLLSNKAGQLL